MKVKLCVSLLAGIVVTLALGCADLGAPSSMSGTWHGKDGNRNLTLQLHESSEGIEGRGVIESPYGEVVVWQGLRTGDDVILDVTIEYAGGLSFGTVAGRLHEPEFAARLDGLAFATDSITLRRWQ